MGVFLTGTMNANSGNFYTVTTGYDCNGDTNVNDRPTAAGLAEYQRDLSANLTKEGDAYCRIPGQVIRRNQDRGPGFLNFTFNISKAFFIGQTSGGGNSGKNINLFANMTNAFNRTNYGVPSGTMSSPSSFGKPNSARNAREVEVGLRFQF
jgi:hypothetical protein